MKQHITVILLIFLGFWVNAQNTLKVSDAEVSFVFVNNNVNGTITGFSSSSSIDFTTIENSIFKGSVDVETISTGNSLRNWSLRRGKYFDVDNFPKIAFESTSVQQEGEIIIVKGKLSIKDVTKDINFRFEKTDKQLVGKAVLYSSDFGIFIKKDREKNKVQVKLVLQLK